MIADVPAVAYSIGVLEFITTNPNLAETTKRKYTAALNGFLSTGHSVADIDSLRKYALALDDATRAHLSAAVTLWSIRTIGNAKAAVTPDNTDLIQAIIWRCEAIRTAVPSPKIATGDKVHHWLTAEEVQALLDTCDLSTNKGKRDWLVLAILVGAGLRRNELTGLTFDDVTEQPVSDRIRTVLAVRGKGDKHRIVPINDRLAAALRGWQRLAGPGFVARSVNKADRIEDTLSDSGVFDIVRAAGAAINKPALAPHSLRRTFAQLGYEAGIPLTQISKLLGHSSLATTQRYLNLDLNLDSTISDFIPL